MCVPLTLIITGHDYLIDCCCNPSENTQEQKSMNPNPESAWFHTRVSHLYKVMN